MRNIPATFSAMNGREESERGKSDSARGPTLGLPAERGDRVLGFLHRLASLPATDVLGHVGLILEQMELLLGIGGEEVDVAGLLADVSMPFGPTMEGRPAAGEAAMRECTATAFGRRTRVRTFPPLSVHMCAKCLYG